MSCPRVADLIDRGDPHKCVYCGALLAVLPEHWTYRRTQEVGMHCGCGEGDQSMETGNWSCVPACRHLGEWWSIRDGFAVAQVDHVVPRSRGGTDEMSNLVLACSPCNSSKGAKNVDEWLEARQC